MPRPASRQIETPLTLPTNDNGSSVRVRSMAFLLAAFAVAAAFPSEVAWAEERSDREQVERSGPPPSRIVPRRANSKTTPPSKPAASRLDSMEDEEDSSGFSTLRLTAAEDESAGAPPLSDQASPTDASKTPPRAPKALFNVDLDKLGDIPVKPSAPMRNKDLPSSYVSTEDSSNRNAATTGELLEKSGSVNVRRTSAINMDALVRGYNSQQTVAVANGMNQLKTRVDIDSLFSQVDPGIVQDITVIDGPYSALYGPGFAFLVADLHQGERYDDGFQGHASGTMSYGTNGGALYTRGNAWGGGSDYSAYVSYGVRAGNDYRTGGSNGTRIPSSYNKQDSLVALSRDLRGDARLDFNYLRTEINNLELPGVVYDINNSINNQFNIKYVVQEDRAGPEQFAVQGWFHETGYQGDTFRAAKQDSFYHDFITVTEPTDLPVNTVSAGRSASMGTRTHATFGDANQPQWTIGADWRRSTTQYSESNFRGDGLLMYGGNLFGIPGSSQNDIGVFSNVMIPVSDGTTVTVGGRLDYVWNQVDANDPVITTIIDPARLYYIPGTEKNTNGLGMGYITQRSEVTEHWTVNSGAAFAMRNATPSELYSDQPYVPLIRFGNSFVDGNSDLAPEQNFQLDLGANYTNGPSSFGVRGYHSLIHNYILPVASSTVGVIPGTDFNVLGRDFSSFPARGDVANGTPNADNTSAGYTYGNIEWATLWGLDCFTEYRVQPWLSLGASTSYVQGTNHSPEAFMLDTASTGHFEKLGGSDPLPNIYPLSSTLRARVFEPVTDKWSCEFVTRIVGEQSRVARTLAELPTDSFAVCSLRSYYRPREWWRVTAAVENMFNHSYTQHGSLVIVGPNGLPTFVREPGIGIFLGSEFQY